MGQDQIVSILGSSYFEAIATLVDSLVKLPASSDSEVKTSNRENGYAAGICILAVVSVESWLMRLRYLNRGNPASSERFSVDFLKRLYPDFPIAQELTETIVLRDLLVHNHVWEIEFSWDDSIQLTVDRAVRQPGSGDRKYLNHIDEASHRTRKLGLHIIPTGVDRSDAKTVTVVAWDTLLFLEHKDRASCFVSHSPFLFRGAKGYFKDVVAALDHDA